MKIVSLTSIVESKIPSNPPFSTGMLLKTWCMHYKNARFLSEVCGLETSTYPIP